VRGRAITVLFVPVATTCINRGAAQKGKFSAAGVGNARTTAARAPSVNPEGACRALPPSAAAHHASLAPVFHTSFVG
jgi:hypothetical protein